MAESNEKAGGGDGSKEAGGGVGSKIAGEDGGSKEVGGWWKGTEFRIHLQEKKFDDVQVRVLRKKELIITERDTRNLIIRSKLPRTAAIAFSAFMEDGFLVVSFDRLSFGRKVWKFLLSGAILAGVVFGCVADVEGITDRQRNSDDQRNADDGQQ